MNKTGYSSGPKSFGCSVKKSWFDEGDRFTPGPGAHNQKIINQSNPPKYTVGRETGRDTFLDKHFYKNPSPDRYRIANPNTTHLKDPAYKIPKYDKTKIKEDPNKIDEGSAVDYKPHYNAPKYKYPNYSFGYNFERDYGTQVPPPNAYDHHPKKHQFNRTQHSFSVSDRPAPYGQHYRNPGIGQFNVTHEGHGTKYSIGQSKRPSMELAKDSPPVYYNIDKNIKTNFGKTMGNFIAIPKNKDLQEFPSPDKYNISSPDKSTNIITFRSNRADIIDNNQLPNNPSPHHYDTRGRLTKKSMSFTKEKRYSPEPDENPGVGTYEVVKDHDNTLGKMGMKLKKMTQFVTPAGSNYSPKIDLAKENPKRVVNCYSNRTDFSKSVTGPTVGPGNYNTMQQERLGLGKIGKGDKFAPNKNKNPGPGSYDISGQIGKLPNYYSGNKKVSQDGFSCFERARLERIQIEKQKWQEKQKIRKQKLLQEQAIKEKQQAQKEQLQAEKERQEFENRQAQENS